MDLSTDFFIQHPIDFEHKNYLLLAFLKSVEYDFEAQKIYPGLNAVISHIRSMKAYREQQQTLNDKLKTVKKFDWKKLELEYDEPIETQEMREVNKIVDYSLSHLGNYFQRGSELFEQVSSSLNWRIVGIIPNYLDEGYIILHTRPLTFQSYQYKIGKIELNQENYFGISLELKDETKSRFLTYTDLKGQLIRENPELPLPMTFAVETDALPLKETLLPVIKTQALLKIRRGTC